MMNDINQYGILFNYNKQWQRGRTQQTSLVNSLRTPQSFRSYFESQLSSINESMNRISIVIGKVQDSPAANTLLNNQDFQADFATLLKKVNDLSSQLKLYNQEFIEMSKRQP
jgi:phospholipid/cholesterol/gamma-HCH transport system substrate-binding protein